MTDTRFAGDVGSLLLTAITADEVLVVNPTATGITDIVFGVHDAADPPTVDLLADRTALKSATADFVAGGHAADLVAEGTLSVRWADEIARPSLLVADDSVVSVVAVPDRVAGLVATDETFVTEVNECDTRRWVAAEAFRLPAPPLSDVRETLAAELGTTVAADFDTALAELPAVRDDAPGLDEVTVSLLVAARHGVLLYDVSRWGEDVGLASKATFSRTKGELEAAGLIATEKVPIAVGRPRLRLRLATDRLESADVPELTRLARDQLGDESGS
jgi:hypothetical protein